MAEVLYRELSYSVVGAAMEVHRNLGPGFLESVYQKSMEHELSLRQIPFAPQMPIIVGYKDITVGRYRADFLVDEKIIIEVKAMDTLLPVHEAQAIHYLAATRFRLAMLLNFGTKSLQVKRLIR